MRGGVLEMKEVINPRILLINSLLIAVCFFCFPVYAQYGGSTGTGNDPYQIIPAENIILLGGSLYYYNRNFILTVNVDLSGFSFGTTLIAPDTKGAR